MPPVARLLAALALTASVAACGTDGTVPEEGRSGDAADVTEDTVDEGPADAEADPDDAELVDIADGQVNGTLDRSHDGLTLFVGDSVLVSVADDLAAAVDGDLAFDGADCRRLDQPVAGPCGGIPSGVELGDGVTVITDAMDALTEAGRTPEVVVLVLANNSSVDAALLDAAMEPLADVPEVWWVNTRIDGYGRQDLNNAALDEWAAERDRVGIIDWFSASDHPSWFRDNVHPNDIGQQQLAELIADHLACECVP